METFGRTLGKIRADARAFQQFLARRLCFRFRHRPQASRIAAHESLHAFHHDGDRFIEFFRVARRLRSFLLRLGTQPGRPFREPAAAVWADMALRVIFLVDLHDARDGVHLFARAAPQHILARAPFPVRQNLVAELADVFLVNLEAVLRPRRQILELAVNPAAAALREHDARAHARRPIAHDELARRHANRHLAERRRKRLRPHEDARLARMLLIDARHDARLLDRHKPRLRQHRVTQPPDALRHRKLVDSLRRKRHRFFRLVHHSLSSRFRIFSRFHDSFRFLR